MSEWKKVKIGEFLTEREGRFKPDDKRISKYQRLDKIDFSGNSHLSNKPTKTDMILVQPGDLVISGINVAKGAITVYQGDEPVCATIHYSSYTFDSSKVDLDYFKFFVKSDAFVAAIQKQVKGGIKTEIKPGMLLSQVRSLCEDKMLELGADSFWYWDVGAFVFSGDETTVSVSGKEYSTSDRTIGSDDIVTIDLSPQIGDTWGDHARTVIIENGCVVKSVGEIGNSEWREGLMMEKKLHDKMTEIVNPDMTFEDLYYQMNEYIKDEGYINLDFMGNLGHSIVRRKDDRIYIEKGNRSKLGDVDYFTFEPHISVAGSKFGYKREDIYYFENGVIKKL